MPPIIFLYPKLKSVYQEIYDKCIEALHELLGGAEELPPWNH